MTTLFRFADSIGKNVKSVIVDTREHPHAIQGILRYFDGQNIKHIHEKLDVGDYQIVGHPEIVVDRKQNLQEVCGNLAQEHDRFKRELLRAMEAGIQLVVLIEHSARIKCIEDVRLWENPRLKYSPMALTGERLANIMLTQQERYGVRYEFCDKRHTGQRIMEILEDGKRMDKT